MSLPRYGKIEISPVFQLKTESFDSEIVRREKLILFYIDKNLSEFDS